MIKDRVLSDDELRLYVCFLLPVLHPKRWWWYWRISQMYSQLTNAENSTDHELGLQDFK